MTGQVLAEFSFSHNWEFFFFFKSVATNQFLFFLFKLQKKDGPMLNGNAQKNDAQRAVQTASTFSFISGLIFLVSL